MSEDILSELFSSFKSEAFRFEGKELYRIEDTPEQEEFESYLRGELFPRAANQEWYDEVEGWTASGKKITRVRLVPKPITPYVRYELEWAYPYSLRAGESVFVVTQEAFEASFDGPLEDFWLFDRKTTALLEYDEHGGYVGASKRSDPFYDTAKAQLLSVAVPLQEYLSAVRSGKLEL